MADVTFLARQQGLLSSPWRVYLFDSGGAVDRDPTARAYVRLDPSGRWELGADGPTIYATSDRPGICRATNAMVYRVRFALIEALSR